MELELTVVKFAGIRVPPKYADREHMGLSCIEKRTILMGFMYVFTV